jgi:DNA-binding NarL/FixJ family response regulator
MALGRTDEARELAGAELDLAHRWGATRTIGVAQCAAGMTRPGPAGVELLRGAVATLETSPAQLELARALVELGARLRRERRITEARTILRRALDLAHETGGFSVAEWARDELLATGAKPRRPALHGRESLTPRELRVAELAASGLTNRQIAQSLFITARTVEHHLTSSYLKLNIQTRAQLTDALQADRSQSP